MFDNRLNEDGGQSDFCAYNPKADPKDDNSADVEVPMSRITGTYYNNQLVNSIFIDREK